MNVQKLMFADGTRFKTWTAPPEEISLVRFRKRHKNSVHMSGPFENTWREVIRARLGHGIEKEAASSAARRHIRNL
jgi:hypothetical protein